MQIPAQLRFAPRSLRGRSLVALTVVLVSGALAAALLDQGSQSATAQTSAAQYTQNLVVVGLGSTNATITVDRYSAGFLAKPPDGTSSGAFLFRFTAATSAATNRLFRAAAFGTHLESATLTVLRNERLFLRYELTDVFVKRVVTAGATGGDPPRDVLVSLEAAKVSARFPASSPTEPLDSDGSYDERDLENWNLAESAGR